MDMIQQLEWRYATKRMTGDKIPEDKLDRILRAIQLSPSSLGLQPYTIYIVESDEMKKKIHESGACTQPQILGCSQLIIFAVWMEYASEDINDYMNQIMTERGASKDSLEIFRSRIESAVSRNPEDLFTWNARQAYIALGFGLVAAASEGIDSTPMEGFDSRRMDTLLGLTEKKQRSVALLALGYRDAPNDYMVNEKKVRREKEHLFVTI